LKNRNFKYRLFLLILLAGIGKSLLFSTNLQAQVNYIKGTIEDKNEHSPLVFVDIALKKAQTGTISNDSGQFVLQTPPFNDTLLVSFVGYDSYSLPIQANKSYYLNIKLESMDIEIGEVVVKPGKNPAFEILKKINKNKKKNNYYDYKEYQMQVYNKITIGLNNVDSNLFKTKAFKSFDFMMDYAFKSNFTHHKVLPVFMSETNSDYFYQKRPRKLNEIIKANKMSGFKNKSYSQFTGKLYADLDIYQGVIPLFEKNFINPISPYARPYYKYLLIDSMWISGNYCYHIQFIPRLKRELTFSGDMYIDRNTYAIKKIKARISPKANINFIKDLEIDMSFEQVMNKYWFPKENTLKAIFSLSEKQISFYGEKKTIYSHAIPHINNKEDIFTNVQKEQTITSNNIFKDSLYWKENRPVDIDQMSAGVYKMVDTLMKVPRFIFMQKLTTMLYTGYWEKGLFEFGPYYTLYSYNAIEGNRYRLGGRTSNKFSKKLMLNGYLAYGDLDKKFKYGAGAWYVLRKNPRTNIKLNYFKDLMQLSNSNNAFMSDDILNSLFSVSENTDLLNTEALSLQISHDWFDGLRNEMTAYGRQIHSSVYHPFQFNENNYHFINDYAIQLRTRFAYGEKYLNGEFERSYIPSDFPIINFYLLQGKWEIPHYKSSNYTKLTLSFEHNFMFGPLGYFEYKLEAEKLIGKVPYPLLNLHAGNETYYLDTYAFNLMNYYEFASDENISVSATHHFNGFIFGKIPLINTLKLRSLVYAHAVYGRLSNAHSSIIALPENMYSLSKMPYIEAGVGIENVLKVLRIDAIWRLTYKQNPGIQTFGIRAMLQVDL